MTIERKTFSSEVRVKASAEDEEDSGIVEMIVSTYDTDSVGDRVIPGAFSKTLAEWEKKGTLPPFIWSHQHDNPDAYLGDTLEMKETDQGLYVKAKIDMDNPFAKRVYTLMRKGQVSQASFAYEVKSKPERVEEKDADGNVSSTYYALRELKLHETGPTLIGANQGTTLLSAKSRAELMKDETSVKCEHCDGTGYQVKDDELAAKSDDLDSDLMRIRVALMSEELEGE